MDLKDVRPALEVGEGKFDFAVKSPGTELARGLSYQRRVERVRAVRGHQDFDVSPRIEAVELVHNFEHRSLDVVVVAVVVASPAHGVDFVEEDDAGLLGSGHLEELADHTSALAYVLLDEL